MHKTGGAKGVMPRVNILDETIIDNHPISVYKALLDEYSRITNWWKPNLEFKPRKDISIKHERTVFNITENPKSRISSVKFINKEIKRSPLSFPNKKQ